MVTNFLQSDNWERFQQGIGKKTFRLNNQLLIKNQLPFSKSWFYCPWGKGELGKLDELVQLARKENAIFFHLDPFNKFSILILEESTDFRFSIAKTIQPQKTLILDIDQPRDKLLAEMKEKTRYNIRLAEKKNLIIKQQTASDDFWRLMTQTSQRDCFSAHSRNYYQRMVEIMPEIELWTVFVRDKAVASAIFLFDRDNKIGYYLHGASDYSERQLMAPYLLQWQGISIAQKMGLKKWDFWGIDEDRYPGVTRFKLGFGGQIIERPPAQRLIFQPLWYRVYSLTHN
ncbi:MAG: methicillin resistance protein [Candidatus Berkelbacteria bacterium Licking1014_2]|uniref:Methicillin resistance protein n=1 Tax=Candidatus Berkelbacteria bacterium Licking1014_2 TaxID=2017146 RepID=A0A554LXV0_9BACT|nr:MAG: methicillin resistance protein [Candidatus Berkelbacteria bacterium Licking1014_2]